jgi:Zn-dependent M28 family amino/carboxypeptidase
VLGTHFDTPPRAHADPDPENHDQPVPGANDGTSGVAVLLSLVPSLREQLPPDVGFAVILFDGEEVGAPGKGGYCLGSIEVRRQIKRGQQPDLARAELGLVLDMVGDPDLEILEDPSSVAAHPRLVKHIRKTARSLDAEGFRPEPGPAVIDDHVYLIEAGIPSVLLIDYDDPAWHTLADDRDNVSTASLDQVRVVVLAALVRWFTS